MRTLPDHPSLDHLRRQAKDLHRGLRDQRPDATLADAQASLAEQYGFRTWTELKAEVDRRQGQGEVAGAALAAELAHRFDLGAVTAPMRSVAPPDDMGRRWSLETDRGRWALRTMETWWPIVDAETDVALQEAALAAGVLLPPPVRSRAGAVMETVGDHPWRAYRWIHSGPPLAAPVSARIARDVGGVLATVHGLALPVDRVSPWHASRRAESEWHGLAAAARAERVPWARELAEALPGILELFAVGEGAPVPAPVLCHNTLGPANVRLGEGGQVIVTGWEHAGGQPPGWELSDALLHWMGGLANEVNATGARAMVEGYRAVAGAAPPLDVASFRGAVTSWLNYAHGQCWMALHPDGIEARDRPDLARGVRHLLAHHPSRNGIERLLEAALSKTGR